jgi:hypothetical protein
MRHTTGFWAWLPLLALLVLLAAGCGGHGY